MGPVERPSVLAIGIDAAEPTLVRALIDRGELPCLRGLLDGGTWGCVRGPADIGSGAVWPTFLTGRSPLSHGVHSLWSWDPATMGLSPCVPDRLTPFWSDLARQGHSVCVLDVPFAPLVGLPNAVEVIEWGAHDRLTGRLQTSPPGVRELVQKTGGSHPFTAGGVVEALGPRDHSGLSRVVSHCVAGIRQRGELASVLLSRNAPDVFLAVFTEVHRASHLLWHTVDPAHPAYDGDGSASAAPGVSGGLPAILREVDRQIDRLVRLAGPGSTVLVFSLHGMRSSRGVPTILDPLFASAGLTATKGWRARSRAERAGAALNAARRWIPPGLKRLLYRPGTRSVVFRLTRVGALPAYDWSRTLAFPLPTDQHGWVRVNLAGREAQGIVEPGQYEQVCSRLETLMRSLMTHTGCPVVKEVVVPARHDHGHPPALLPDLIVHWTDAASADPLRLSNPSVSAPPALAVLTGQHAFDGFFIHRPGAGTRYACARSIAAEELHRVVRAAVACEAGR